MFIWNAKHVDVDKKFLEFWKDIASTFFSFFLFYLEIGHHIIYQNPILSTNRLNKSCNSHVQSYIFRCKQGIVHLLYFELKFFNVSMRLEYWMTRFMYLGAR